MTGPKLTRTSRAVIHDEHAEDDWCRALLPFGASYGLETDGVRSTLLACLVDGEIEIHIPREMRDKHVRKVIAAAAAAVGLEVTEQPH